MSNPFGAPETAAVYSRGRPDHHPRTVDRIAALIPRTPVELALDVACGTGSSTAALRRVAVRAVGVDVVPSMVATAAATVGAVAVAAAERLPFADGRFDLVAVASAVHWFDQQAFFAEALRVLGEDGAVAVTEHFFLGEMEGVAAFGSWARDVYAERYPTPARGRHLSVGDEVPDGVEVIGSDSWPDPIAMGRVQLVDYLLTQSNTVAVVDAGRATREDVRGWLTQQLAPFFADAASRTLHFWGSAVCYRRASGRGSRPAVISM